MINEEGDIMKKLSGKITLVTMMLIFGIIMSSGLLGVVHAQGWTGVTSSTLYSVYMVSADDGWAVGYD
jgi:hypothetical protein